MYRPAARQGHEQTALKNQPCGLSKVPEYYDGNTGSTPFCASTSDDRCEFYCQEAAFILSGNGDIVVADPGLSRRFGPRSPSPAQSLRVRIINEGRNTTHVSGFNLAARNVAVS